MPKFHIYERVPCYVDYRKTIEAPDAQTALQMAREHWTTLDAPETRMPIEEVISTESITYFYDEVDAVEEDQYG